MTKVVVVGCGFGGCAAAQAIEKKVKGAEVTIIDSRPFLVHKYATLRAMVEPSLVEKVLIPNENVLKRGKVVEGTVTSVSDSEVTISGGSTLPFDYLVCATGSRNAFADVAVDVLKKEEVQAHFSEIGEAIESAERLLIVGGGAVGVELAGELCEKFPSKKLTLVEANETLVFSKPPFSKKLTSKLLKELKTKGVDVMLNTRTADLDFDGKAFLAGERTVDLNEKEGSSSVTVDLVLRTVGTTPNSSVYPEEWLSEKKLVKVNSSLQVVGHKNIFAVGDVSDSPFSKQGFMAGLQGAFVSTCIAALEKKKDAKLKAFKSTPSTVMSVPIGSKGGATQLGPITLGSFATKAIKGKTLFIAHQWKDMNAKA